ncbi:transglutaminase domain-containing protein [Streptomyces sp. NPDC005283]|uniref:transglutaminase domain-containing protein n=1 Tax=Streptomyces sp. NPDC005283 TaxID=3156871 RepID=UPI0034531197
MTASAIGRTAAGTRSDAELLEVVERLWRVPDRHREFVQDAQRAAREHQIDAALLGQLTDLGLPSAGSASGRLYDRLDLTNAALALRLPNARALAMRSWAGSLNSSDTQVALEIEIGARCPSPGHAGPCSFDRSAALNAVPGYAPGPGTHDGVLRRRIDRQSHQCLPELRELASLARPLQYHLLPMVLRADLGFLAETGLADCGLAALYLTQEALARGMRARSTFGFFLARPYSMEHTWTEVRSGGAWVAIDPHLVNLLTDWSFLDASHWPPHRSIDGCVLRVADEDPDLITHYGAPTLLTLTTRHISEGAAR